MGLFRGRPSADRSNEMAETIGRNSEGGRLTAIASLIALVFSAYSVYETAVRRPELRAFVPPVIRYSSPYNDSNFEVFEVPVTVANAGARAGTVLSMDLEVTNPRNKAVKRFYSAAMGRWTMENVRTSSLRPFTPLSLPGKASASDTILFYSRDTEKVQQVMSEQGPYELRLVLNTAQPDDLGFLDRLWQSRPAPVVFQMVSPEIDHRSFIEGTLQLHSPDWQAAGATATTAAP